MYIVPYIRYTLKKKNLRSLLPSRERLDPRPLPRGGRQGRGQAAAAPAAAQGPTAAVSAGAAGAAGVDQRRVCGLHQAAGVLQGPDEDHGDGEGWRGGEVEEEGERSRVVRSRVRHHQQDGESWVHGRSFSLSGAGSHTVY